MSTITREFTKEQLQQIIETDHVQCGEASALARIALASLEAEPVFEVEVSGSHWLNAGPVDDSDFSGMPDGVNQLYAAPPAPVSGMDEAQSRELFEKNCMANIERNKWHPDLYAHLPTREQWAAWEACRAAMLQGADGNSPVLPDELIRRIAFSLVYLAADEKLRSDDDSLFALVRRGMDVVRKELAAPRQE
jgi:hypothetical protein